MPAHGAPAAAAGHDHQHDDHAAGHAVADAGRHADGGDPAHDELALAADVDQAGPGRHRDGEGGQA